MADDVEQDGNEGKPLGWVLKRDGAEAWIEFDLPAEEMPLSVFCLGPLDQVAEAMARFLEQIDYGELG
jgi:hypothetical protein